MGKNQLSPISIAVIIVIAVALIGLIGFQYLNRPPRDPIAEEVNKERAGANVAAPTNGPMGGAAPPKAGASDYAPASGSRPGTH